MAIQNGKLSIREITVSDIKDEFDKEFKRTLSSKFFDVYDK